MPQTLRLNIRLPHKTAEELDRAARAGGYASACQLARCVLVQFTAHAAALARKRDEYTDWMDDMVEEHLDPANRKRINERL